MSAPDLTVDSPPQPCQCGETPSSARLVATVGHELRAPLAAALLYLGVTGRRLAGGPGDDAARRALSLATRELRKLERLIGRVIEIEQRGRALVRGRQVRLDRIVRDAVSSTVAGDPARRSQVELVVTEGLSGWWDDSAVEQIVGNLLSNALKFGEGRPVRVVLEPQDAGARLTVEDHGRGISGADHQIIFERRARATEERYGGLGLGLWIVKKLTEAHGGRVSVDSRPGQGATFIVSLPELRPRSDLPALGRPASDRGPRIPGGITLLAGALAVG